MDRPYGSAQGPIDNQADDPNQSRLEILRLIDPDLLPPNEQLEDFRILLHQTLTPTSLSLSDHDSIFLYFPIDNPSASGGTSDLYMAIYRPYALKLAMKRPKINFHAEDILRRFHREAKIWSKLKHGNILPFFGIMQIEHHLHIVAPWRSLGDLLAFVQYRLKLIGEDKLHTSPIHSQFNEIRTIREIAAGLGYLHSMGSIHGDMKAKNVLLTDEGCAQICDFGLTKTLDNSVTSAGLQGFGTIRWQSPQLLEGKPKSAESDVYAFGMTIVEVLTANYPFPHLNGPIPVMRAVVLFGERPAFHPMLQLGIDFEPLWKLAARCWEADPQARPLMGTVLLGLNALELGSPHVSFPRHGPLSSDRGDDTITRSGVAWSSTTSDLGLSRTARADKGQGSGSEAIAEPGLVQVRAGVVVDENKVSSLPLPSVILQRKASQSGQEGSMGAELSLAMGQDFGRTSDFGGPGGAQPEPVTSDTIRSPLSPAFRQRRASQTSISEAKSPPGDAVPTGSRGSTTDGTQTLSKASNDSGFAEGTLNKPSPPGTVPLPSAIHINEHVSSTVPENIPLDKPPEKTRIVPSNQMLPLTRKRSPPKLMIRVPILASLWEELPLPNTPNPSGLPPPPPPSPPPFPRRPLNLLPPSHFPLPSPRVPPGSTSIEPPLPRHPPNLMAHDPIPMPTPPGPLLPIPRSPRHAPNLLAPAFFPLPLPPILPQSVSPAANRSSSPDIPSFPRPVMFTSPEASQSPPAGFSALKG